MLVEGLYSIIEGGQVKWTVYVRECEGMRTTPGKEDEESERGRMIIKYGSFTNPDKRGLELTGAEEYNVEILYVTYDFTTHGVVGEDGTKVTMMDGSSMELMSEEARKKLKEDQDPADNPSHTYSPQPGNLGEIIWISGLTGMGKTTTARVLQEKEGFVSYEGDCFLMGCNPYVGASAPGPSYYGTRQLAGISAQRKAVCKEVLEKGYIELFRGNKVDNEMWDNLYTLLCEDIQRERVKLGGRWVVNQAVYTRYARQVIRDYFGDDLVFIVLGSGEEDLQVERLSSRMMGEGEVSKEARETTKQKMKKYSGGYEEVGDDEQNTFVIKVTKSMTPEQVAEQVLRCKGK